MGTSKKNSQKMYYKLYHPNKWEVKDENGNTVYRHCEKGKAKQICDALNEGLITDVHLHSYLCGLCGYLPFTKYLEKRVKELASSVMSGYEFNKWWEDDFRTDYGYASEEELRKFPRDDLEIVMSDWIACASESFTSMVCEQLKGKPQESTMEIIQETIKAMLWEELKNWK